MKKRTLSKGAKEQALLFAGRIRFSARYSAMHPGGFATDQTRIEMLEIADLLESAGQPHRGRRGEHGVPRMALQLVGAGYTLAHAATYALAYQQWEAEYVGQRSKTIRARLQAEIDEGLNKRMRSIATKDAKRVAAQVQALQAKGLTFK